jgi:hypothetical protein
MVAPRRETSAETAARFLAARDRRHRPRLFAKAVRDPIRAIFDTAPRRIALDFAEPTLRLIHEVLLDAMHANVDFGNRRALLMIAEQMVAAALGEPACDDPPLTDRGPG